MFRRVRSAGRLWRAYFSPARDFPIAPSDVLRHSIARSHITAGMEAIEIREVDGEYWVVGIRGVKRPLYWPQALGEKDLYRVIGECFDEGNWHFYEIPETRVGEGEMVLDCGAAEGIFGLRVLERAGRVTLFEPAETFVKSMGKTFAGSDKVEIVPMAIGAQEADVWFEDRSIYSRISEDANAGRKVHVTTLDAWASKAGRRVDYIKADVEGYELDLLQGAVGILKRDKPKLALTVYHPENNWREIDRYIRSLVPEYSSSVKGLNVKKGVRPIMLHAWVNAAKHGDRVNAG